MRDMTTADYLSERGWIRAFSSDSYASTTTDGDFMKPSEALIVQRAVDTTERRRFWESCFRQAMPSGVQKDAAKRMFGEDTATFGIAMRAAKIAADEAVKFWDETFGVEVVDE